MWRKQLFCILAAARRRRKSKPWTAAFIDLTLTGVLCLKRGTHHFLAPVTRPNTSEQRYRCIQIDPPQPLKRSSPARFR
jgi:hypothetical protein